MTKADFQVTYLRKDDSGLRDGYGRHEVYCYTAFEAEEVVAELKAEFGNKDIKIEKWSEPEGCWVALVTDRKD